MMGRAGRTVAWLCLVLQLVGGAWALGRMLCVAADGHVAIELVHSGACDVEARRHHRGPQSDLARGCQDHSCTDIALVDASTRPSSELSVLPVASTLAWTLPSGTQVSTSAMRRLGDVDRYVSWDASPHSRQSIVLLI